MSKRNVAFIKPAEPSFLKKLKQEIGYIEGPTVDTKREKLPDLSDDDEERLEEQPQIVVLNPGDLNAEEVESEKKKLEEEENCKPADLNKRVIFRTKPKLESTAELKEVPKSQLKNTSKNLKSEKLGCKLSFNIEEEEDIDE